MSDVNEPEPGTCAPGDNADILDMLFDANDGVLANTPENTFVTSATSGKQTAPTVTKEMPILDWVHSVMIFVHTEDVAPVSFKLFV